MVCSSEVFESPFGPAHPIRWTQTFKLELDGFWVGVRGEEDRTPESPAPAEEGGRRAITYDSSTKKFDAVRHDNLGGYAIGTADGSVDKAVYTGSFFLKGAVNKVRNTSTMKVNETHHLGEGQMER